ncbi:hypothetical protein [Pseudarthrobacter sp. MM222]|uniref:hypothetical protein n=1 Tax=Pseudarthrobacter sp. MM222 TaxID=3018929 RepID=UPI00222077F4|nr:hypothetical protein [Pseudarthrobacter sp. MM222]CAI3798207.1 hypothetical protein NKCBBBOE_02019 [Pseudarthrobacter sp. MM222]
MSIDSFRALDTTRIFASRTINYNDLESKLVRTFPPDYLLNRIGGGAVTGMHGMFISAEMNRRKLTTDLGTGGRNRLIMVSCEYDQRQAALSDRLTSNNLPAAPQVKNAGCD